jgi:hypothetical protein
MASQAQRKGIRQGQNQKEDGIVRHIQDVFKTRQKRKVDSIRQTILEDDKLRKYKEYRREVDEEMRDLEKEKSKILKKKRNRKDKTKLLRQNYGYRLRLICVVLKKTFRYYENLYFEDDNYRDIVLLETLTGQKFLTADVSDKLT